MSLVPPTAGLGLGQGNEEGKMRYWAIETSPGLLLVDEVAVRKEVKRILGQYTLEALCLFTSRVSVDTFIGGFLPEESYSSRQELERAFKNELEGTRGPLEEPYLKFPTFTPRELVEVIKSISSDVSYVVLDPDTSEQEVWDIEQFEAHLVTGSTD
jgi:hypothetical protein